jgi:hypothetical protein
VADTLKDIEINILETINPFILVLWEERMQTDSGEILKIYIDAGGSI